MSDSDDWITIEDIRRYHCVNGIGRWFTLNGLDFRKFIRDGGISATELLANGDALAERVVRLTREARNG